MTRVAELARCPSCRRPILEDHPYAWCTACGEPLPENIRATLPLQQRLAAEAAAAALRTSKRADTGEHSSSLARHWVVASYVAIFLVVVPRTDCYWERLGGGVLPVVGLLVFLAFILAVTKFVAATRAALRTWSRRGLKAAFPALAYLAMIDAALTQDGISCETFLSPVAQRACYEGTMVEMPLRLRENGDFELQVVGFFAWSSFHTGSWQRAGDTLRLAFAGEPLVAKYLWVADTLRPIPGEARSYPPYFLQGWCRGDN